MTTPLWGVKTLLLQLQLQLQLQYCGRMVMNDLDVERLAADVPVGGVRRLVCPVCLGGKSGERSFDMGRESTHVWWICHRASCDEKGRTGARGLPMTRDQVVALDRIRPYEGRLMGLGLEDLDYFKDRFGLPVPSSSHIQLTEHLEYALHIRDPRGRLRGYVIRQPTWKGEPECPRKAAWLKAGEPECPRKAAWLKEQPPYGSKAKTHMHRPDPVLAWYFPRPIVEYVNQPPPTYDMGLVLVEDQISAMKVADTGHIGVALLGVSLNADKVRELVPYERSGGVVVALDPDAQGQAQQMRRKWQGYFKRMRLVSLPADPKDMDLADLGEALC